MTPMQIMSSIRTALTKDPRPQREIADLTGIHYVNLSQFKAGDRDLPLNTLCKLAKVLGLEILVKKRGG